MVNNDKNSGAFYNCIEASKLDSEGKEEPRDGDSD
jgi:hypothetical protein